jgi:hypothetical protein
VDPSLYQAAEEWAAVFNSLPPAAVGEVISEAAADEYVDERTNLFLMAAGEATEVALVLSVSAEDYVIVRWDGEEWAVDPGPVDWQALEDEAFGS